ncbi:MAG TPA: STAS domain-containing protein [Nocardioidaceae bacterium]|nr:STAS domain-containing protein [Nocardioidaceae bacterium]
MSVASTPGDWTILERNRQEIIERWVGAAAKNVAGRMTQAELDHDVREIFDAIVALPHFEGRDLTDPAYADLRSLLGELARARARQGFSPTETATGVFAVKEAVLDMLEAQAELEGYQFFAAFSRFVDDLGLFMLDSYAQAREAVITEQAASLLELSTPVVRLWEGIVTLPLVGTLDSARTQVVMERLLEALVSTGSDHAIIDITGVPAVDTQVAQHLLKTVMAARLLGAECIISGVRPQIAQTVVGLGIDFGTIATKSSLSDALLLALRRSGYDVVKRANRER